MAEWLATASTGREWVQRRLVFHMLPRSHSCAIGSVTVIRTATTCRSLPEHPASAYILCHSSAAGSSKPSHLILLVIASRAVFNGLPS